MRLPRKMRFDQTPFGIEWNAMVDYLTSLRPIDAPGIYTNHTGFGVSRQSANKRGAIDVVPKQKEVV